MRLVFFGSGEFGLPTFEHLAEQHDVLAVVSQPDRPAGRKRILTPTPVVAWAERAGYKTIKSENANTGQIIEQLEAMQPDAAVVIAFGQKLSEQLIAAGGRLVVNLHSSLLPRFRGAAPINHAILAGETRTGVSVIGLSQRMDAGQIYATAELEIDPLETAGELHDRLSLLGPGVLDDVLAHFQADTLHGRPQDESLASRAPKLSKADGTVDFAQSADRVRCRIHGLTPWPGVRVDWHHQGGSTQQLFLRRVMSLPDHMHHSPPGTVLDAQGIVAAGRGAVRLLEIQLPGKNQVKFSDFARGHDMKQGDRLLSHSE